MAINYASINARAVNLLLSVKKHVPAIDSRTKALVELRVSQINGCAYCVDLHANEARAQGVSQQILDCLPVWQECGLYTQTEMAALSWAECLTHVSTQSHVENNLDALLDFYNEVEAVDLTLIVSLMNCMNRMAIGLGDKPEHRAS